MNQQFTHTNFPISVSFAENHTFSAKERDSETSLSYFGSRYYSSDLSIWLSVDPKASKYPSLSPYVYCADNPVKLVDPNGMEYGDYYNYAGEYLGSDKIDDNKVYVAKSKTDVVNEDGTTTTSFIEAVDLGITHDEFCIIANIIKKESSHANNEDLWLAHTANNAAKKSKMSLYKKLMSGYSSVNKKTALPSTNASSYANSARAAVINVLIGGADPTNGASLWDGVDFLAWGLSGPNSKSHAKFRQYSSITIPLNIYNSFLSNVKGKYGNSVKYYGVSYSIPANVFSDKKNMNEKGFYYETGVSTSKRIEAVGNVGRTIFWKIFID